MSDDMLSVREAAKVIGVPLHSTDQFVSRAIEWLAGIAPVTIEMVEESWRVEVAGVVATADERLDDALAGAVLSSEVAHERQLVEKMLAKCAAEGVRSSTVELPVFNPADAGSSPAGLTHYQEG